VSGENHRPAVLPAHRKKPRLTPGVVEIVAVRPDAEEDGPPFAILRLDEIRVPGGRDRKWARGVEMTLRENRIDRPGREWPARRITAKHHLGMLIRRPALGANEKILTVVLEEVRRFDPDRFLRDVDAAVHD